MLTTHNKSVASADIPHLVNLRAVVFDLDGTLYSQLKLYRYIIPHLLWKNIGTRNGRRVLAVIREYRCVREELAESESSDVSCKQYSETSKRLGIPENEVRTITDYWLQERPLQWLQHCVYEGVHELFESLSKRKIAIGILSDYPVKTKLSALGLRADVTISALDSDVDCFKPCSTGLKRVLEQLNVEPHETIMVGDRVERDGKCAKRNGVTYFHRLNSWKKQQEDKEYYQFYHFNDLTKVLAK